MNAFRGALAVLIFELAIYLCPPDHDPVFTALPLQLKLLTLGALACLMLGALTLFVWGAIGTNPWAEKED